MKANSNDLSINLEELKLSLIPFINSIPEGFLMINKSGKLITANSKCCQMFGYDDGYLNDKNISILIPMMYSKIHSKHIEKFFKSPHFRSMGTSGMKLYGLKKNGTQFPIEVSLGFYSVKKEMYAMAFIIDVTNKHFLDNALKQSEHRFRQIFQGAPVAIYITHKSGKLLDVNNRFVELTKFKKDHVIGENLNDLNLILNKPQCKGRGYAERDVEVNFRTKDHEIIDVLLSTEKMKLENEITYISMFNDISERKNAIKQLNNERNFINTILETVGALIMVQSTDGNIISFNRECEKTSGFNFDEIKGKTPWSLPFLPKDQRDLSKEIFNNLKITGEPSQCEMYWKTRSRKRMLIKWSNTVTKNENKEVEYIISTGIDITESKKLEVSLYNAVVEGEEKERMRLSKEMHDGLSPLLSSVRNNLEVLGNRLDKSDEKKIKYYENSISLLENALDEVRTISKDLMPVSLKDFGCIIALKQLCERIDSTKGIHVNCHSKITNERFSSSVEIGIFRITQELINNAIRHSGAESIDVHIIRHNKSVVLSVEDDGIGFLATEKFEKGFGLRNITSRVKSLNGFISIDSRLEKGTLVTIELPV